MAGIKIKRNDTVEVIAGKDKGKRGRVLRIIADKDRLLVEHGRRGHTVVRLKGGDPFLFGRGGEEVEALTEAGVPWEIVPGVSSAFGVPAVAGIPVTHRGLSASVTVVAGRVDDPASGVDWDALAKVDGTLVILMGMKDRADIAAALVRGGDGSPLLLELEAGEPALYLARAPGAAERLAACVRAS